MEFVGVIGRYYCARPYSIFSKLNSFKHPLRAGAVQFYHSFSLEIGHLMSPYRNHEVTEKHVKIPDCMHTAKQCNLSRQMTVHHRGCINLGRSVSKLNAWNAIARHLCSSIGHPFNPPNLCRKPCERALPPMRSFWVLSAKCRSARSSLYRICRTSTILLLILHVEQHM